MVTSKDFEINPNILLMMLGQLHAVQSTGTVPFLCNVARLFIAHRKNCIIILKFCQISYEKNLQIQYRLKVME